MRRSWWANGIATTRRVRMPQERVDRRALLRRIPPAGQHEGQRLVGRRPGAEHRVKRAGPHARRLGARQRRLEVGLDRGDLHDQPARAASGHAVKDLGSGASGTLSTTAS